MRGPLWLHFCPLLICAAGLCGDERPGNLPVPAQAIVAGGEDLVYEVRWTFVKLGTIHLRTFPDLTARAEIDSYDGVPFVDLHSVHFSTMDSLFFSRACRSIEKRQNEWWGLDYVYDPAGMRVIVHETYQDNPGSPPTRGKDKDTLQMPSMQFVDGLSIAYFPRRFIHSEQTLVVPTVLYGKRGSTTFHFTNERTTEEIDALDAPVRCVEVTGNTSVEGIFGMTGDFTGWFSDDEAAVPIKGKLKVLLGNVTVELIKWSRGAWAPPH